MSTIDMKCNLAIESLLEYDFLRDGAKCSSCQQPLGIHRYKNEILKEISKSSMNHKDANMKIKGNINYDYDQSVMEETNRSLLSYEIVYQQNKNPPSLSSHSSDSESIKSSASVEEHSRLHSDAKCTDSQMAKKNKVIERKLEDQLTKAVSEQAFLCKEFLKKHYCSHIGSNNVEELYNRILSMINKDTNRVYHLMKHARHSCFGLVQITMNDDQLMDLFKFLDTFVPSIYE
ncbi:unnamed protein product [Rotaria socialis]|uniref:Uncharacterized protein n=1 Tax=Rotaria socialis TaxID=392032 RepID=A0A820LWM8_9BILA|nr:unnamed protein product [Rotaria socialis]CAF3465273.1 unnamed protein product [Rotaria socialis]CAF4363170.1 unnamed protein product [Rotaria socialis]CAF4468338.1 unnamed protein product [Rotaria socialis]